MIAFILHNIYLEILTFLFIIQSMEVYCFIAHIGILRQFFVLLGSENCHNVDL